MSTYPKTILISNQKGGVGKTTIADELCFACERTGQPFTLRDYDGQGGLIHEPVEHPDPAYIIIDTPGALQPNLKDWIEESDIIVIPTLMSQANMQPLERMIEIVSPWLVKGKEAVVILNQWDRYTTCDDFAEWFDTTFPFMRSIILSNSEMIKQAQSLQKSIVEYKPHSRAATEMENTWLYINELLFKKGKR